MICYVVGERTTEEPFDRAPLNRKYSDYMMWLGATIIRLKREGYTEFVLCSESEFIDDFNTAVYHFFHEKILDPGYLEPTVKRGSIPPKEEINEDDVVIYIFDGVISRKWLQVELYKQAELNKK